MTREPDRVVLRNEEAGGIGVGLLFAAVMVIVEVEAIRLMEKDMSDFVEEREPELIIALPQVGELDEGVPLEPPGGTASLAPV